jgi:hypothetical protein
VTEDNGEEELTYRVWMRPRLGWWRPSSHWGDLAHCRREVEAVRAQRGLGHWQYCVVRADTRPAAADGPEDDEEGK